MENQLKKDLSSYVSFALKVKPSISFQGHYDREGKFLSKPTKLKLEDRDNLSEIEFAEIEELMDNYLMFKPYMPPMGSLDNLKIVPREYVVPEESKEPGVEYRKVTVNAKQLELAKVVAKAVDEIHGLYIKGEFRQAKANYNALNQFLSEKRTEYIGDFKSMREIEDSLGMFGVGGTANPEFWGEVAFIVIEVWSSLEYHPKKLKPHPHYPQHLKKVPPKRFKTNPTPHSKNPERL